MIVDRTASASRTTSALGGRGQSAHRDSLKGQGYWGQARRLGSAMRGIARFSQRDASLAKSSHCRRRAACPVAVRRADEQPSACSRHQRGVLS